MLRRRWPLLALIAYAAVTLAILIAPVSPEAIVRRTVQILNEGFGWGFVRTGHVDAAYNVILFIPLGFLMTLTFRRRWVGVLIAIALSVSAELVQTFLPLRTASLRDVITNAAGAVIGAAIAVALSRRRVSRRNAVAQAEIHRDSEAT